jgi:hypothetical protein
MLVGIEARAMVGNASENSSGKRSNDGEATVFNATLHVRVEV